MALLLLFIFGRAPAGAQAYTLQHVDTKTGASFRGLSVSKDNAVWVSGSKGWVGRSADGGRQWTFKQVPGYEGLDFRTLYAFDSANAVIANAGSPAYILRTSDGGVSWKQVYENKDSAAFIDGVDFWNERCGIVHGDPIAGRMLLLYTKDGGKTWTERRKHSPQLENGQASFAASGTSISCFLHGSVITATGGSTSRLYLSRNRGRRWRGIPTPMLATSSSTGIFSFAPTIYMGYWFVAGGDYKNDTLRKDNFFYTTDKGKTWQRPETTTRGYRECLALLYDIHSSKKERLKAMFAVGPSGIDISTDGGVNWQALSDEKGFHVVKRSNDHSRVFLAGSNGKLAVMMVQP